MKKNIQLDVRLGRMLLLLGMLFYSINHYSQILNIYEEDLECITYDFSDANPIPEPTETIYPYFRYQGFTNTPHNKKWKLVVLENDYVKVYVCPQQGGKIWRAINKVTGKDYIYCNEVFKFRNLASRGPWTSGGIEFNFGLYGHATSTATPVDYKMLKNSDGSVSCVVGNYDLNTCTNWRVEIKLRAHCAYFETKVLWYGVNELEENYYHWTNAAIHADSDLEFLFPATSAIGHAGDLMDFPYNRKYNKHVNYYKENDFGSYKPYHIVGKYSQYFGAYWHDKKVGFIRCGNRDGALGAKVWIWGLSDQGMIWENILSDTNGQYVEIQSGRNFNQNILDSYKTPFKYTCFKPYLAESWSEYWYPISSIGGAVEANEFGALNAKIEDNILYWGFSAAQNLDCNVKIANGDKIIYSKELSLSPLDCFVDSINLNNVTCDLKMLNITIGDNLLTYSFDADKMLSRPLLSSDNVDWDSEANMVVLGNMYLRNRNYAQAEKCMLKVLEINPNNIEAASKMALLKYRSFNYDTALSYAKKALSMDTYSSEANYYYGLINEALGNIYDALDGYEVASLGADQFRAASYIRLAIIYMKKKLFRKAIEYSDKALVVNSLNVFPLQLKALAYRYLEDYEKAQDLLLQIEQIDPLSHFVDYEKFIYSNTKEMNDIFVSNFKSELPLGAIEDLGLFYVNTGCFTDAIRLFSLFDNELIFAYWLKYLDNRELKLDDFNLNFVFPYRKETKEMLGELMKKNSDWQIKYLLSLVLRNRGLVDEANELIYKCGNEPNYAPFYAVRAMITTDLKSKKADLQKANFITPNWRYESMLIDLTTDIDEALELSYNALRKNPLQSELFQKYVNLLLKKEDYKKLESFFEKCEFIPMEGSTLGRDLYREAKLMRAMFYMNKNKYNTAIKLVQEAKLYPVKLGAGRPYVQYLDERLENFLLYKCNKSLKNENMANYYLNEIISYVPHYGENIDNYSISNELITLKALLIKNENVKALDWISNLPQKKDKVLDCFRQMQKKEDFDLVQLDNNRLMNKLLNSKLF